MSSDGREGPLVHTPIRTDCVSSDGQEGQIRTDCVSSDGRLGQIVCRLTAEKDL